jgi:hypothetical protein
MDNILLNKYISNKKSKENIKDTKNNNNNSKEKSEEDEDDDEIDTKIFNGLLIEEKKLSTNNSNNNDKNNKMNSVEKNSRNFDTYINENSNLIDLNFISFGDVNSLYNFQNGKLEPNINKKADSNNKNNNNNNKSDKNNISPKNKLNIGIFNSSQNKFNGYEEKPDLLSQKNKRKNSNGSLLNSNNSNENKNEEKINFLNRQIVKINLFGKSKEELNKKEELTRNYWESSNLLKISEINKGNAILVSVDDNIINFPAYLLPKGAKLGETYKFEIKSMDKGFIYKNKKANEIDEIQKKFLNPDEDKNEL